MLREVEQRERLEVLTNELESVNQKLVELGELKSEFLRIAAHDVKNPMAIVKGFAELIGESKYAPAEVREKAAKIKEQADKTLHLVTRLLDAEKLDQGKMEYSMADVDIVPIVRSIADDFKIIGSQKGVAVEFESSVPAFVARADQERMREVFQNLVGNSIKFTDRGHVKVIVTEEQATRDKGQGLLIEIEDTGRGMSKELQQRLFQRFVRDEKTAKEVQGTGLGLYIAKEIVTAHRGEIWAESEGEGKGSKFFVRLSKG